MRKDIQEKLEYVIKEINMPFLGVINFIDEQIKSTLEKFAECSE